MFYYSHGYDFSRFLQHRKELKNVNSLNKIARKLLILFVGVCIFIRAKP